MDGRGSIPGSGKEFLSTPYSPDRHWGLTQPPIQWVLVAVFPEIKQPRREADHSPPSSAEAKNGGVIPPFPTEIIY
jgi:hypothetical protein